METRTLSSIKVIIIGLSILAVTACTKKSAIKDSESENSNQDPGASVESVQSEEITETAGTAISTEAGYNDSTNIVRITGSVDTVGLGFAPGGLQLTATQEPNVIARSFGLDSGEMTLTNLGQVPLKQDGTFAMAVKESHYILLQSTYGLNSLSAIVTTVGMEDKKREAGLKVRLDGTSTAASDLFMRYSERPEAIQHITNGTVDLMELYKTAVGLQTAADATGMPLDEEAIEEIMDQIAPSLANEESAPEGVELFNEELESPKPDSNAWVNAVTTAEKEIANKETESQEEEAIQSPVAVETPTSEDQENKVEPPKPETDKQIVAEEKEESIIVEDVVNVMPKSKDEIAFVASTDSVFVTGFEPDKSINLAIKKTSDNAGNPCDSADNAIDDNGIAGDDLQPNTSYQVTACKKSEEGIQIVATETIVTEATEPVLVSASISKKSVTFALSSGQNPSGTEYAAYIVGPKGKTAWVNADALSAAEQEEPVWFDLSSDNPAVVYNNFGVAVIAVDFDSTWITEENDLAIQIKAKNKSGLETELSIPRAILPPEKQNKGDISNLVLNNLKEFIAAKDADNSEKTPQEELKSLKVELKIVNKAHATVKKDVRKLAKKLAKAEKKAKNNPNDPEVLKLKAELEEKTAELGKMDDQLASTKKEVRESIKDLKSDVKAEREAKQLAKKAAKEEKKLAKAEEQAAKKEAHAKKKAEKEEKKKQLAEEKAAKAEAKKKAKEEAKAKKAQLAEEKAAKAEAKKKAKEEAKAQKKAEEAEKKAAKAEAKKKAKKEAKAKKKAKKDKQKNKDASDTSQESTDQDS